MWPPTTLPLVLHIPHAGTAIPEAVLDQFLSVEQIQEMLFDLTDWYTNELFQIPGSLKVETPISRVVVDTERYQDDAVEAAARFGQGVIYTHSHKRSPLRRHVSTPIRRPISEQERTELLEQYYKPWHLKLEHSVAEQLERFGYCIIVDCHSFPSIPLPTEVSNTNSRPDICIGTSTENTPLWLKQSLLSGFRKVGYHSHENSPFAGSIVPSAYIGNQNVLSVMIEINRDLYLEPTVSASKVGVTGHPKKSERFEVLRHQITSQLLIMAHEAESRLG